MEKEVINIVLDTNALFINWYLQGPNIELLNKFIGIGTCKLIIPEVVLREAINKFREEVDYLIKKINQLNGLLIPHKNLCKSLVLDNIVKDYESALNLRCHQLGIIRTCIPNIQHHEILARDLGRQRPFQNSGKGYRDTLIWETILRSVASKTSKTYFITNNSHDFADLNKKCLHADLINDLIKNDLPKDCVILCNSLSDFVNTHIKPITESEKCAYPELLKGEYKNFHISNWFETRRESIGNAIQRSINLLDSELKYLEDPSISFVEDPGVIEVRDLYELDGTHIYMDVFAIAMVSIDGFILKSDYDSANEVHDLEVWDSEWNNYSMLASINIKLPLSIALSFNNVLNRVDGFDINIIEFFGHCPICDMPVMNDASVNCEYCNKSLI